jgi:YD repeat-containing protein
LDTLTHKNAANGNITTRYFYDNQLRLTTTHHPSTGSAISTARTYNKDGRVTFRTGPATTDGPRMPQ